MTSKVSSGVSCIRKSGHVISVSALSQEELQIELKDREVEIERIKKQRSLSGLTLFAWLRDLFKKEK